MKIRKFNYFLNSKNGFELRFDTTKALVVTQRKTLFLEGTFIGTIE